MSVYSRYFALVWLREENKKGKKKNTDRELQAPDGHIGHPTELCL